MTLIMENPTRKALLDDLYNRYNRREYVHPDPLEFLYGYEDVRDREIVALVASALAYGRVRQILKSVAGVLEKMGDPLRFLAESSHTALTETFEGFKHRFTTGEELALMLGGAKDAIERYGSLEACFVSGLAADDETVFGALGRFAEAINAPCESRPTSLVPLVAAGSACKRLHLFLRWMVRFDEVDPGGWERVPRRKLVVPLDTHMFRICRALGMTSRNQADGKAAIEITRAFGVMEPEDPVKYDFALTRLGIRDELDPAEFLSCCARAEES